MQRAFSLDAADAARFCAEADHAEAFEYVVLWNSLMMGMHFPSASPYGCALLYATEERASASTGRLDTKEGFHEDHRGYRRHRIR